MFVPRRTPRRTYLFTNRAGRNEVANDKIGAVERVAKWKTRGTRNNCPFLARAMMLIGERAPLTSCVVYPRGVCNSRLHARGIHSSEFPFPHGTR